MRQVNLRACLITAFCLIIFAGFTQAQAEMAEPNETPKVDSNEIELAKQKRRLKFQKQKVIRNWRRLKPEMTQKEVRKILGGPKLIQGGSHECILFYQDLPVVNAKPDFEFRAGGKKQSCVGGVKDGFVFFEARRLEVLIEEETARYRKTIREEEGKYEKSVAGAEAWLMGNSKRGGRPDRVPEYFKRKARIKARYQAAVEKAGRGYERRVKNLIMLYPPPPVLRFFNQPDWNRFEQLSINRKPDKIKPEGQTDNWKIPLRWRNLKINMTPTEVHTLLGEPERSETNVEGRREYYGDVSGHGELFFSARSDLKESLDSWVEPFWPAVRARGVNEPPE